MPPKSKFIRSRISSTSTSILSLFSKSMIFSLQNTPSTTVFPRSIVLHHKLSYQLMDHAPNYISPILKYY
ncbi:hypothetical protein BpHYR1_006867 [Brachionus plicatilis]|uniref:Uncharacterized protein n=1 Tax=Brachionus plicatilis TaxID=10195 RepID=A0A3M7P9H5_BRAPC|nr:hypothetical protein BpHYR1_006867 [Brachionus plicatilis]